MSISFQDLQQATTIDDRDQLLIWQNSSGRNRRITRAALAGSRGFGASIVGVVKDDELAPNTPSGLTVSTGTETAQDGTERVYIRASINANTESDLDSYAWSIRRVSGTPTFDQAGNLTGYGGAGQAFDPVITVSKTSPNSSDGTRMQWDVSANVWYEVRVRSIDRAGNASAFTPLNSSTVKISAKDNSIPLAPTNITINSAVRSVFLRWTNASDRDLAGVKIYRSNDQKLIASASRNGVEVTVNTTAAHGFSNGNAIIIAGLSAGTVNPNGQKAGNYAWAITVLSSTSFKYSLPSGTGTENYTVSDAIAIPFSNSSLIWNGYADSYTDTSITEQEQGTTFYYRLTSFDYSGNESVYQSAVKKVTPGQIDATDVKDFAITATKRWNNTIVLEGDQWFDQKSDSTTTLQNSIAWNQHSLYYKGVKYTVAAGNVLATTQIPASTGDRVAYVYATIPVSGTSITYNTYVVTNQDRYPTLNDSQFMIATNVNGAHDLAWNSLANAVIGSAWIQNAAITNAKIESLAADKIDAGTIESKEIVLGGGGVFKSSGATSFSSGSGFWLEGGAGNVTKFGIGDLSGTTHGYLKWNQNTDTLSIKGEINATSGTFGSGFGTANTTGVKVDSSGLLLLAPLGAGNNGRIAAKIDWATNAFAPINTSGFYLGGNNDIYRFFIGQTGSTGLGGENYLYWNGSSLDINGTLVARSIGNSAGGAGLTIRSGFGIRYFDKTGVLTITGGDENGVQAGSQIDFVGVNATGPAGQANGQLILSAGYKKASGSNAEASEFTDFYDGSIVFRTSYGSDINAGANLVGIRRLIIERNGTVTIGSQSDAVKSGAPNSGSGKLIVETSVEAPTYTSTSSKRFKKKIKNLKNGLETISKLRPVVFDWKTKDLKNDIGLIAEEVNEVVPNLVGLNNNGEIMGIDYGKLTPILIQAVKELALEVQRLKNKIG